MKIVVFAGPSLNLAEGSEIIPDALFLPPLKPADLISAIENHRPDVVCIADDYSGRAAAVWHSEILYAMQQGVKVYGAAAIGAIRALELDACGMSGIGRVYEMLQSGEIEDDDEVLSNFICDKDNAFLRTSEPLVNIRETCARALAAAIIDKNILRECLLIAKGLHWSERTFPTIFSRLEQKNIAAEDIDKLRNFVAANYVDIQKLDCLKMLEAAREYETPRDPDKNAVFPWNKTRSDSLRILYERDRQIPAGDNQTISLHDLATYTSLHHPQSEELTFNGLNREITAFMAGFLGLAVADDDIENEGKRFRKKYSLQEPEVFAEWLLANNLSETDFTDLMREMAACRVTQRWFRARKKYLRMTKTVLDELRLKDEFSFWKDQAGEHETVGGGREQELEKLNQQQGFRVTLAKKCDNEGLPWNISPLAGARESGLSVSALYLQLLKDELSRNDMNLKLASMFCLEE